MDENIEELFLKASDADSGESISMLLGELGKLPDLNTDDIPDNIMFLIESWSDSIGTSDVKSKFCLTLAEWAPPDTPVFRNALTQAIKNELPEKYCKQSVFLTLGLREPSVPLKEIIQRFKKLAGLNKGVYIYQCDTHIWAIVNRVDEFTSMVIIHPLKTKKTLSIPLQVVISDHYLFDVGDDIKNILFPVDKTLPSSVAWREAINQGSLTEIEPLTMREIALYSFGADYMSTGGFDEWWTAVEPLENKQKPNGQSKSTRNASEARSIQELHLILSETDKEGQFNFSNSDIEKLNALFSRLKPPRKLTVKLKLIECITMLSRHLESSTLKELLSTVHKKIGLWPSLESVKLAELEVWGEIKSENLAELANCTVTLFDEHYLVKLTGYLPQRCFNVLLMNLDRQLISEITSIDFYTPDLLLWIWKNRKKKTAGLTDLLEIRNVVNALSIRNLPKVWRSSQRELSRLLIDNVEFHRFILDNAGDDLSSIVDALHAAGTLSNSEQQSLLVKLSRESRKLRKLLEKGAGKKLMSKKTEEREEDDDNQPLLTSIRSYNERVSELDDIIKKQIPENRAAIAHARSFGDLRENAEHDEAQRRKGFLLNRRAELEQMILMAQPTDFKDVSPTDYVIVGTSIEVEFDSGDGEILYLAGAWDSDPENNLVSYTTKMGQALFKKKVGDDFTLPDGRTGHIVKVSPLPEHLHGKFAG